MDEDMPGYAWELLPFKDRPLDLYRAHFGTLVLITI